MSEQSLIARLIANVEQAAEIEANGKSMEEIMGDARSGVKNLEKFTAQSFATMSLISIYGSYNQLTELLKINSKIGKLKSKPASGFVKELTEKRNEVQWTIASYLEDRFMLVGSGAKGSKIMTEILDDIHNVTAQAYAAYLKGK